MVQLLLSHGAAHAKKHKPFDFDDYTHALCGEEDGEGLEMQVHQVKLTAVRALVQWVER